MKFSKISKIIKRNQKSDEIDLLFRSILSAVDLSAPGVRHWSQSLHGMENGVVEASWPLSSLRTVSMNFWQRQENQDHACGLEIHRGRVFRLTPKSRGRNRGHVNFLLHPSLAGSFALFREFCTRILKSDQLAIDRVENTGIDTRALNYKSSFYFIFSFLTELKRLQFNCWLDLRVELQ